MLDVEYSGTKTRGADMPLPTFEELFQKLKQDRNYFKRSHISPLDIADLSKEDIVPYSQWFFSAAARQKGLELMRAGKMTRIILNGGMATRMNNSVKSLLIAHGQKSFLQLKLEGTINYCTLNYLPLPHLFFMNSLFTHQATLDFLKIHNFFGYEIDKVHFFVQPHWPRLDAQTLTPLGDINDGYASCGHGDFLGCLMQWRDALDDWGIEWIELSNIDNLAALPSAQILGTTALNNWQMMAEIAKRKNDTGGAPVRLNGKLTVLEGPYFPENYDQSHLSYINTNNLLFNWDFLKTSWYTESELHIDGDSNPCLPWNLVSKKIAGRKVFQFEHFAIDMVRFAEVGKLGLLEVLREWPTEKLLDAVFRFLPIKTFEDLNQLQPELEKISKFINS